MEPFSIAIPESDVADLRRRLRETRWPRSPHLDDWSDGTSYPYLRELVEYWTGQFDWRAQERRLNLLPQFVANVSGLKIHFIHLKSQRANAIPILLAHGWPGGINEFEKLAALLMDAQADQAFDLVIPSMPGFGFSETRVGSGVHRIADLWGELMSLLGYNRFVVQGGDWGAWVGIAMSRRLPDRVSGLHLNYVPVRYIPLPDKDSATPEELEFLKARQQWLDTEGGYSQIQGTKPQSLGVAMDDSPAGTAAWIVEKFHGWSDNSGDIESVFSKDELLTNVSLYWFTNAMYSAMRIYKEARADIASEKWTGASPVPVAVAHFPREILLSAVPRSHLSKYLNVQRWTPMAAGGHFAAMEQPALLAADIRAFVQTLK